MKDLAIAALALLLGASISSANVGERTVVARVTVYWHKEESQQRASWNGARLHSGHCAVDPQKIPFGTKVIFPDATCLAVDTGPAVVSRKAARKCGKTISQREAVVVDRYFEKKTDAIAWEQTHPHFMTLHLISPSATMPETPPERVLSDFIKKMPGRANLLGTNTYDGKRGILTDVVERSELAANDSHRGTQVAANP